MALRANPGLDTKLSFPVLFFTDSVISVTRTCSKTDQKSWWHRLQTLSPMFSGKNLRSDGGAALRLFLVNEHSASASSSVHRGNNSNFSNVADFMSVMLRSEWILSVPAKVIAASELTVQQAAGQMAFCSGCWLIWHGKLHLSAWRTSPPSWREWRQSVVVRPEERQSRLFSTFLFSFLLYNYWIFQRNSFCWWCNGADGRGKHLQSCCWRQRERRYGQRELSLRFGIQLLLKLVSCSWMVWIHLCYIQKWFFFFAIKVSSFQQHTSSWKCLWWLVVIYEQRCNFWH